jgi:hypothetical protein
MYFPSIWNLYTVKPVELGKESIWIGLHMRVVVLQYFPEEFMFGMVYGFDDIFVISREVEETPTLSWRPKFG